jgi:hypothetical protein
MASPVLNWTAFYDLDYNFCRSYNPPIVPDSVYSYISARFRERQWYRIQYSVWARDNAPRAVVALEVLQIMRATEEKFTANAANGYVGIDPGIILPGVFSRFEAQPRLTSMVLRFTRLPWVRSPYFTSIHQILAFYNDHVTFLPPAIPAILPPGVVPPPPVMGVLVGPPPAAPMAPAPVVAPPAPLIPLHGAIVPAAPMRGAVPPPPVRIPRPIPVRAPLAISPVSQGSNQWLYYRR